MKTEETKKPGIDEIWKIQTIMNGIYIRCGSTSLFTNRDTISANLPIHLSTDVLSIFTS